MSAPRLLHALDELFENDKREYASAAQKVMPRDAAPEAIQEEPFNPHPDERPLAVPDFPICPWRPNVSCSLRSHPITT